MVPNPKRAFAETERPRTTRRGALAPLFLLITARPEFRPPWGMRSHHGMLALAPLDRYQVRHMVAELSARHALPKEVVDGVTERTGGVPLFVEEVTRLLLERGAQGGIRAIPPTLQQSLTARLDRLGSARARWRRSEHTTVHWRGMLVPNGMDGVGGLTHSVQTLLEQGDFGLGTFRRSGRRDGRRRWPRVFSVGAKHEFILERRIEHGLEGTRGQDRTCGRTGHEHAADVRDDAGGGDHACANVPVPTALRQSIRCKSNVPTDRSRGASSRSHNAP